MTAPLPALQRLLEIMAILRAPGGCPWDAAQTPESLRPYLVEETYEVLEALEHGEPQAICEELGDLLLQVVFQARIFEERGAFAFGDVAESIALKLERRHPHIFGGDKDMGDGDHHRRWEAIKRDERRRAGKPPGVLQGIPAALPPLQRASKVADKAARAGFCWPLPEQSVAAATAAISALGRSQDALVAEQAMGDLLFVLVLLSRQAGFDPGQALQRSIDAFLGRFEKLERQIADGGGSLHELSGEALSAVWAGLAVAPSVSRGK